MAQALSATALSQERAFELARLIETRLAERAHGQINAAALHVLAEEVLLAEEGGIAAGRYRRWRRLDRLDRPLVVLIGGTTGVGKSTHASMWITSASRAVFESRRSAQSSSVLCSCAAISPRNTPAIIW